MKRKKKRVFARLCQVPIEEGGPSSRDLLQAMVAHGADLGSAVERRGLLQDGSHEGVVALALSMSGDRRRLVLRT